MRVKKHIAIDNVCCWPNLTKCQNGRVVAVIYNQPSHGLTEGCVEAWSLGDDGIWSFSGIPVVNETGTNRMNVACGLSHSGSLISVVGGWNNRPPVGSKGTRVAGDNCRTLDLVVAESNDEGSTWSPLSVIPKPEGFINMTAYGDIIQLDATTLGFLAYVRNKNGQNQVFLYTTDSDGKHWEVRSEIKSTIPINESFLLKVGDSELVAICRSQDEADLLQFRSIDNGASWGYEHRVTFSMQHPAHLLQYNANVLILTYGIRNPGNYGVGCRLSRDNGKTWSQPYTICLFEGPDDKYVDCGYPSSVMIENGQVLTAYYCGGIETHQRYHMGTIIWNPAELDQKVVLPGED